MSAQHQAKAAMSDDHSPWLVLPEAGWMEFSISAPSNDFLQTFDDLAFDNYASNCQRYRRFSQFQVMASGDEWALETLPHRPFVQSAEYNAHSGGVMREFEPLRCDIAPCVNEVFKLLNVSKDRDYHLDVHQYRVYATPQANGISVPEGAHRDGQQYVAILVFRRHLISGAELSLHDKDTKQIFHKTVIGENRGVVLDDERMLHNASEIIASGNETGYRDYVVLNINLWDQRRYGLEFEQRAMKPPAAHL